MEETKNKAWPVCGPNAVADRCLKIVQGQANGSL